MMHTYSDHKATTQAEDTVATAVSMTQSAATEAKLNTTQQYVQVI